MKFLTLLLCAAFIGSYATVNAKSSNHEQQTKTSAAGAVVKPTSAPLVTSTVAPTKAPKVAVTPTKATTHKATGKSNNASMKTTTKVMEEPKPTVETPKADEKEMMEAKPLDMPAMDGDMLEMPKEVKPLAVTGFITQDGNIYEIEDKDGIGKIEGRQNPSEEHICRYGSIVVYSDVPCDEVTSVKISEFQQPAKTEDKEETKPQEESQANGQDQNQNKDEVEHKDGNKDKEDEQEQDANEVKPVRRRPNSKKPRNKNRRRQQANKRRNGVRRKNGPARRQGQNQRRSQDEQALAERRRRQQLKRRRAQLANSGVRRQGQNQRRRNRGGNRRQQVQLDDYDYLDYNRGRNF
ncbi:uncharacterized protein [Musca autumnalis]|uniref:uncharacterized protein n=1 Tax=Musca autumnalis TaxID=221902 RepID=UPI003CF81F3E